MIWFFFFGFTQGVAVALFLIFARPPRLVKDIHNMENLMDPLVKSVTESGNGSVGGYGNGFITPTTLPSPVPTERPPGMDGIIACSSYKNRLGTWNRKESELIIGSHHLGGSYADESRGLLGWPLLTDIIFFEQYLFLNFFFLKNVLKFKIIIVLYMCICFVPYSPICIQPLLNFTIIPRYVNYYSYDLFYLFL